MTADALQCPLMREAGSSVRWGLAISLAISSVGCAAEVVISAGEGGACRGVRGEGCDAEIAGQCVGARSAPSCEPEACACSSIQTADSQAALQSLLATASPGSCIELTGSGYEDVDVPEGVQVLARSARLVELDAVTLASDSAICGVALRQGLTVAPGARGVAIRKVLVAGATEDGLRFEAGSSGRVADTTVSASGQVGLLLAQSADVTIERSAVIDAENFGIAGTCGGCGCPEAPPFTVKLRKVVAEGNRVAGMWFEGIDVQAETIAVRDTRVGPNFSYGSGFTMRCGRLVTQGLSVEQSADYGLGLFDSDATVAAGPLTDVRIADNLFGIWAVDVGASASSRATVSDAVIADNRGAGLAMGGVQGGGVVELGDSVVRGTQNVAIPVLVDGVSASSEDVGDGILWMDGVEAHLSNIELSDNERASLLINGGAQGSLDDLRFSGGDTGEGPLLQNYFGGPEPTVSGTTPALEVTAEEVFPVPMSPVQGQ